MNKLFISKRFNVSPNLKNYVGDIEYEIHGKKIFIHSLHVQEEYRGLGYGKVLFKKLLKKGFTIILEALPYDNNPMKLKQLTCWYYKQFNSCKIVPVYEEKFDTSLLGRLESAFYRGQDRFLSVLNEIHIKNRKLKAYRIFGKVS